MGSNIQDIYKKIGNLVSSHRKEVLIDQKMFILKLMEKRSEEYMSLVKIIVSNIFSLDKHTFNTLNGTEAPRSESMDEIGYCGRNSAGVP